MIELIEPDWWNRVPTLTGPTVQLREIEASDTGSLYELITDPRVACYLSPPPPSLSAFHGFVNWAHDRRAAGTGICLAVVPHGLTQAIGLFQLRSLEPKFRTAEWGFALGASFWSTGIFMEAAGLVADFAFKHIGVERLEARAVVENSRGCRGLEKLGAKGEAILRKSFGRSHSQFLWAILAEEWRPPVPPDTTEFDAARIKRDIARAIAAMPPPPPTVKDPPATPFPFFLTDPTVLPDKKD